MSLRANYFAGLSAAVISAGLSLTVIPQYIQLLGIEAYGLIGFFLTLQTFLQLLDLGMSTTLSRESARIVAELDKENVKHLLHTTAAVAVGIAFCIGIFIFLSSDWIVQRWLSKSFISHEALVNGLNLIGLVIACRWPINIYQGVLIGRQQIKLLSVITIAMSFFSTLGTVFVLRFFSQTLEAFFVWQALIAACHLAIARIAAWDALGGKKNSILKISPSILLKDYSLGLAFISVCGILLMQADKLILSKTIPLTEFGQYMLATTFSTSLYIVISPFYNMLYPKLASLVASGQNQDLNRLYRLGSAGIGAFLFSIVAVLVLTAPSLILVWTGSVEISQKVAPIASLLLIAYCIHGLMYVPHALMLSLGKIKEITIINGILVVIQLPLTYYLSIRHGVIGGAWSLCSLFMLYFFLGIIITHRHYRSERSWAWILKYFVAPLGICVITTTIWTSQFDIPVEFNLKLIVQSIAVLVICITLCLAIHKEPRDLFKFYFSRLL
jgi:O-antigen/teichoic acid export membrane protein